MDLVREALAEAPARVGPGHLAQAALREDRWRALEESGQLLSAAEVAALGGHPAERARDFTSNLRRRKGVAGVKRRGGLAYPDFQFVDVGGALGVAPAWEQLRLLVADLQWGDADLVAWTVAPNSWLEGRTPSDEIRDHPHEVSEALRVAVEQALSLEPW